MQKTEEKRNKVWEVIKVLILAVVIIWIIVFFIDYVRARQSKDLLFCLKETTTEYEDGSVYACTGFGYKMYRYNRKSISTTLEFGPFFLKERQN